MIPASVISALPTLLVALVLATDRKIVRHLRTAQATDASRAVHLVAPGPIGPARLRRLVNAGAVGAVHGKYYLSEQGHEAWRARRRKRGLIILGVGLAAVGLLIALGVVEF